MRPALVALLLAGPVLANVEFFGYEGLDLDKVRAAIPLRDGMAFTMDGAGDLLQKTADGVRTGTGKRATDIALVCCTADGGWMTYIGLPGRSSKYIDYAKPPQGKERLSPMALTLYNTAMASMSDAVQRGAATEDRSKGYALSSDPVLRERQLAMRDYALAQEAVLYPVLRNAELPEHRRAAAQLLGYASESSRQVKALLEATRDADEGTRNNAIRALGVLAESGAEDALRMPPDRFIDMLQSGVWTDRNKAMFVLMSLTASRRPDVIRKLGRARTALVEMSRWRNRGHADSPRLLLGRLAAIPEDELQRLVAEGKWEEIVARALRK